MVNTQPFGLGKGVLFRLIRNERDALNALPAQLQNNLFHTELTVYRLAAGHCHGIVIEQFISDIHAGSDGLPDR